MEYNQEPRKPQAANQAGRENNPAPKQEARPQRPGFEQQGLGKKAPAGSNPYNKPSDPKKPGQNPHIPAK